MAIESIESFVEDMSYDDFVVDDKTSSAVIRKFEIIDMLFSSLKYLHFTIQFQSAIKSYEIL